jgi:N-acetylneuraminic acid mutarotase
MKAIQFALGVILCFYSSISSAQWTEIVGYPGSLPYAALGFAIGDSVYIGGGADGSTSFCRYDPSTDSWALKSSIVSRAAGVSFAIGSKGYVGLGESYPTGPSPESSVTKDLLEYDPSIDAWTPKANFPGSPRFGAVAFVIGNTAYVGGGADSNGIIQDDFYSYQPATDTWTTLHLLPEHVLFGATFVIGNYGYLATGSEGNNQVSLVWQYNPANDQWTKKANFPGAPRGASVGFALNGIGYVGLGEAKSDTAFSDFYSYDPAANQWESITSFPDTNGRAWANGVATSSAAFVGLGAYFAGGPFLIANHDWWTLVPSPAGVAPAALVNHPNAYPNPTSGFVTLSLPQNVTSAQAIVQNSIGAICLITQTGSGGQINLSLLPPGIYNIEITSGSYHWTERVVRK